MADLRGVNEYGRRKGEVDALAYVEAAEKGDVEIVKDLLPRGGDLEASTVCANQKVGGGALALLKACKDGRTEAVKGL